MLHKIQITGVQARKLSLVDDSRVSQSFREKSIITTNPKCPSSILQDQQTLLVVRHFVGMTDKDAATLLYSQICSKIFSAFIQPLCHRGGVAQNQSF